MTRCYSLSMITTWRGGLSWADDQSLESGFRFSPSLFLPLLFFYPLFFFLHAFFVSARWPPESDRADWPFRRDYMVITWARYVGRARFHGFMRARQTSGMSFDVFSYNRRFARPRRLVCLSLSQYLHSIFIDRPVSNVFYDSEESPGL